MEVQGILIYFGFQEALTKRIKEGQSPEQRSAGRFAHHWSPSTMGAGKLLLNAASGPVCACEMTSSGAQKTPLVSDSSSMLSYSCKHLPLPTGVCLAQVGQVKVSRNKCLWDSHQTVTAGRWWTNASLWDLAEVGSALQHWAPTYPLQGYLEWLRWNWQELMIITLIHSSFSVIIIQFCKYGN